MASTFTSSGVATGVMAKSLIGLNAVTATYNVATAFVINDVVQMVKVPKGAKILEIILACGELDTGSNSLTLSVGDGDEAARFIAASTVGQAGGVTRLAVAGGLGYVYTANDTIDVKAAAAANALASAADLTLTVIYELP